MTRYKLFIFCLLSSVLSLAQKQSKIDSLVQLLYTDISDRQKVDVYIEIAQEYRSRDFRKIYSYANKAFVLAESIDYMEGTVNALYYMGGPAVNEEKFDSAEQLFTKMLDLAVKKNYKEGQMKAYHGLGRVNWRMGKLDKSLENYFKSLEINKKFFKDEPNPALLYNSIGLVYTEQGDFDKALKYYRISLDIYGQLGFKKGIAICYMNIGIQYRNIKDFEKAIDYFSRSIGVHKELNQEIKIAFGYTNIGETYYQMGAYNKALDYYFKGLKIREDFDQKNIVAGIYSKIGQVYGQLLDYKNALGYNFKSLKIYEDNLLDIKKPHVFYDIGQIYNIQNQTELARKYTNLGLVSAQQQGLLKEIRTGAEQLVLIEKEAGNYKRVYEANVLFMQMTDSLHNNEITSKIASLEGQYEFKKAKDSLYASRQQEILLNEERTKERKTRALIVYLFVGLILMITIICFIVYNKSLQRKKIRLLRNRISRDLHDEIGSTLSSISLYGTVAGASVVEDPKRTSELLTLINTYSSNTIESMNDIVWAIDSDNDTIGHMISRMRNFASEIEDTNEWKISIDYESKKIDKNLNMIQRRNMYLIFKESINNAIKYSNGKKISVTIDIEKSSIKLDVIDDGIGFDPNQITNKDAPFGGNGLKNMKERAADLGGKLSIHSVLNEGTQVSLEFNVNENKTTAPLDDTLL